MVPEGATRSDATEGSETDGSRRIGVDVGGTFTDVALAVDGRLVTAKVPTTDDQSVGVIRGIREACGRAGIEPESIDEFAHAMTVSVNALLERAGARTALVTTAGFRDVLEIGRQDRPALYDLDAEKPEPLVPRDLRFEIDERATPEGVHRPVDPEDAADLAGTLRERGIESVAICLLHAYADPENERVLARTLREELDVPVSTSHEVLAEFREYERTATTVVDAYVRPAIDDYVGRLVERAREIGLPTPRIMRANGGTAAPETVRNRAVATTLSGPAAGVVGAAATVDSGSGGSGDDEDDSGPTDDVDPRSGLITFDMGGTSSDVSLVRDGEVERTTDSAIDGHPIRTPMVDVHTVGAGGGSIAWVDAGGALRVGPRSAGATPGPACYGRGGAEPTVTDANVVLGYIGPNASLGGEVDLDADAAREVMADLAESAGLEGPMEAARGVHRVANATMTRAIRTVTVERGHDPRTFSLVAFGGAGPMHATALADDLGVDRVVVPRPGGVLSAFGLLAADETYDAARTVGAKLDGLDPGSLEAVYGELEEKVLADASAGARTERAADCRYVGQSFELTVPVDEPVDPAAITERFHEAHERAHGYALPETIEIVTLRATATVPGETPGLRHEGGGDPRIGTRAVRFPDAGRCETDVYDRSRLAPGASISGPSILERGESTTVLPPGWGGEILADGALVASREGVDHR